ncbi:MAG: potassium channel family protein [bacterium]
MTSTRIAVIGSGHLAYRIRKLVAARGHSVLEFSHAALRPSGDVDDSTFDSIGRALHAVDFGSVAMVYVVDDRDERNLEVLIALLSLEDAVPIVVALFNERVAPHLRAAHPEIRVMNPARIAAPAFVAALDTPLSHTLRYVPAMIDEEPARAGRDVLLWALGGGFVALIGAATAYFHAAERLAWIDALYFVIVTVATVGYGDVALLHSGVVSKVVGIALILGSTCFIWMIFSLTIDRIVKRRVQLALGRKRYSQSGHVILCGLGRLGYFVAEGLLEKGESVLVVERDEEAPAIEHFRSRGVDVYIGDARLPRVLADIGVRRAKALYSVVGDDYVNLEIGLNARSFAPDLRLILRIFDESMSERIKQHLDIHLALSTSAIADEHFVDAMSPATREGLVRAPAS